MPRECDGFFCTSASAGRRGLVLEEEDFFFARASRCREGARPGRPGGRMTVLSLSGRPALAEDAAETACAPASKSPPGIVGARSCAGAVAAHSRSDPLPGPGGGTIGAGAVGASLPPQLLQKFAPSRFSALHTGQIKAMTTDF